MAVKYIPYEVSTVKGQAVLNNFHRRSRVCKQAFREELADMGIYHTGKCCLILCGNLAAGTYVN